eukprot:gene38269-46638_t
MGLDDPAYKVLRIGMKDSQSGPTRGGDHPAVLRFALRAAQINLAAGDA